MGPVEPSKWAVEKFKEGWKEKDVKCLHDVGGDQVSAWCCGDKARLETTFEESFCFSPSLSLLAEPVYCAEVLEQGINNCIDQAL